VIPEKDFPDQIPGQPGADLRRPECVLAHQSRLLIIPNWIRTGGISLISPTGCTHHILADSAKPVRPDGIALENDGSVLLAHKGETRGGFYRLTAGGRMDCVVTTVDGESMPSTNVIVQDSRDRNWITVSTR